MAEGSSSLEEMSAISSIPGDPVVRILLMGRKGSGKSSSGNTILGKRKFKVQKRKKKHESELCDDLTQIGGKQVHVIDCPDLLDPDLNKEKLEMMKEQLVSRCSAGLSSVLLTVPLDLTVQNEEEILDYIKCLFGSEVQKYIMILFTFGDELESDETIDEHLKHHDHADLQRLVTKCGGKFHCFNNKRGSDDQTQELLQKIERMMEENGGKLILQLIKRSNSMETVLGGSERKDQIRLVLLGKTGVGKSSTGNTIIGRNLFESSASSKSQTKQCQSETTARFGKEISVIDTPGLYDNVLSKEQVLTELVKCISFASPGPHAFIFVLKVGRFTDEEKDTIEQLKEMFGENIVKYTMIIFTHKDKLEQKNQTINQFLQDGDPDLQSLVHSCGNRFFFLNNNSASFPQLKDLISKIEMMLRENGGRHFTNNMFERAEKSIQDIQKQKLDVKVKQFNQKYKWVDPIEWQNTYWSLVEESRHDALHFIIDDLHIRFVAEILLAIVVPSEVKASTMKEAERNGISPVEAEDFAVRATGKLAMKMCGIQ